jgi:STE24 endopeptidase
VSARTALVTALVTSVAVLVILLVVLTPWRPLSVSIAADPLRDFTAAEIAREDAFHAAVRPPAYLSLAVSLAVALVLGLTPLGARVVAAVAGPLGGGWAWRVVLGCVALTAIGRLLVLPLDAWREVALRRYGLSTQTWLSWLGDVGKAYGIGLVLTVVVLLGLYALLRWSPQWWWGLGAAAAALLVVVVSFGYPVVVEPLFNRFTPLAQGQLRTSLLEMAAEDGVPARDVLVADASRRTTALNAYVSGFGATRRIVVYDTLLRKASADEVRLIVAHELGHAKERDVLTGTVVAAAGIAVLTCVLALLLRWGWLLRRAGVESATDPRSVALVLAVVAVVLAVSGPVETLVSRRIETRADVHSLDLTRDPTTFAAMQRRLSVTNLSDLDPVPLVFGLFATHPTPPQRIAIAREWARQHRVAPPPPLAPAQ